MEAESAREQARAAARLKTQQAERVDELRQKQSAGAAQEVQKAALVSKLEQQLAAKISKCRSFSEVLGTLCGVSVSGGGKEGQYTHNLGPLLVICGASFERLLVVYGLVFERLLVI